MPQSMVMFLLVNTAVAPYRCNHSHNHNPLCNVTKVIGKENYLEYIFILLFMFLSVDFFFLYVNTSNFRFLICNKCICHFFQDFQRHPLHICMTFLMYSEAVSESSRLANVLYNYCTDMLWSYLQAKDSEDVRKCVCL